MNILLILLVISSVIILLLNVLLFWSIMGHSKEIAKEVAGYKDELQHELRKVFGWDKHTWASNFREYKYNANEAYEKVTKLEQLEVIKEAKKLQQLEQLERQKENVNRELKRLKND